MAWQRSKIRLGKWVYSAQGFNIAAQVVPADGQRFAKTGILAELQGRVAEATPRPPRKLPTDGWWNVGECLGQLRLEVKVELIYEQIALESGERLRQKIVAMAIEPLVAAEFLLHSIGYGLLPELGLFALRLP